VNPLGEALATLVAAPFQLMRDAMRLWWRWKHSGRLLILILGGVGGLYLIGGVAGSQGARFDYFSAAFWALAALGFAALLIFKGGLV
jgi:hypothetical protein